MTYTVTSSERRNKSSRYLVRTVFLTFVLGKWTIDTSDVVEKKTDFDSDWNPYVSLDIPEDTPFDSPKIRKAYSKKENEMKTDRA